MTIARPFCIGVYEVTQEQWNHVFGNPLPEPEKRNPAGEVKYSAAEDFINLLNAGDPEKPYRLPTEAEWEYVARSGTSTTYSFGDDPTALKFHGNCGVPGDGMDGPAPVGRYLLNRWGVYDMYGNVSEWVSDIVPEQGDRRIRRGGSWTSSAKTCSSAARSIVEPERKDRENGFRIVREIR